MIEVKLNNNFLQVKETLTRMGIANNKDKILFQSCHILSNKDKFYITHFKEMFALDGRPSIVSLEDQVRTYSIAKMLESWGMVTIVDESKMEVVNNFKILSHAQKSEWKLSPKYKFKVK